MALKRLNVKLTSPKVDAEGIPTIAIEGDQVSQYNRTSAQMKQAEDLMKVLRQDILMIGLAEVYTRSTARPAVPTFTVKLQDDEGEVLRLEFTRSYQKVADLDAAEELFKEAGVDINAYLQEGVQAKFDNKVFLDPEGNFQQKIYDEFRKAIEQVARRLNVPCPLETVKVVTPKETFHVERFREFPSVDEQIALTAAIPNTTRIVPVPSTKV